MSLQVWRMLLPEFSNISPELDEELFQALIYLERKRASQKIPWEQIASWSADQNTGSVKLAFEDDTELSAQINLIGTFSRGTFMWGWHNPSIKDELKADSLKLKKYGEQKGWAIFSEPMFPATTRDGWALMALAAKVLNADGAYAGDTGEAVTFLTLYKLPGQPQKRKKSIVERMQKMFARDDQPQSASIFDFMDNMIANQVASVQIGLEDLRNVEILCRRAEKYSKDGQHLEAVKTLDEAWQKLGEYAVDQEPAGYIKLARGEALFHAGQISEALNTFEQAEEMYECPDRPLLYQRLGQCYAAVNSNENAIDMFIRLNAVSGSEILNQLDSAHKGLVMSKLAPLMERRRGLVEACMKPSSDQLLARAEAVVTSFIKEMNAFEIAAYERGEEARTERDISSELCAEDVLAKEKMNREWSQLISVWCVSGGKSPVCASIQSPPAHDPAQEKIVNIERIADDRINVNTASDDGYSNWRYELRLVEGDLLIDQLYSVWDGEEISAL